MTSWQTVETQRLIIRSYAEADYDDLYLLRSDPETTRFLLHGVESPDLVRAALGRRLAEATLAADGDALSLAVQHRESGRFLGEVVLILVSTSQRTGEIGFVFKPEARGHGYAAEAASELLRYGFETLDLHRIIGRLNAQNTASAALLGRLGLRQEAHFVQNTFIRGEWADEAVFAILQDEWRARAGG